jgi:hypothetical protein
MTVIVIDMVLAAVAATVNFRVATRVPAHRMLHIIVGALAVGYVVAYGWLLMNPHLQLIWSQFMSGASIIVWPIVWTAPAVATWRERRQLTSFLKAAEDGDL